MADSNKKTREAMQREINTLQQQVADHKAREQSLQERVRSLEAQQASQIHADQEIIRQERLRALEEMAQGVAHNFNNVLVGVLGYAQIIEMQSHDKQAVANAGKIVESALRAKDLVLRLNRSVREAGDLPLRRITTLRTIVQEAVKATQEQASDQDTHFNVADNFQDLPPIKGNPVELHHVLVHLITNAIDAMPEGGEITLSAHTENNQVAICVQDQGIGMTADMRNRIFEPFFTTKRDVGSGLGLAMAYRTITGWGGHFDVDSTPGKGSSFTVWLPIWSENTPADPPSKKPRILVVDDENAVHEILRTTLKNYDLTMYENSEQALANFQPGVYDLALIDLQLPEMQGDELVQQLKSKDPNLIAVLMTGWNVMQGDPRLDLFAYHLPKPFRLGEMIDTIKQALATKKG